ALLAQRATAPDGALRSDHECIARGIGATVLHQQFGESVEVEGRLGYDAARARHIRGVPGGIAAVATEDAEDPDAFMAAQRRSLAVDELAGPRDGGAEADAVLGALHVVVHGLGDRHKRDP